MRLVRLALEASRKRARGAVPPDRLRAGAALGGVVALAAGLLLLPDPGPPPLVAPDREAADAPPPDAVPDPPPEPAPLRKRGFTVRRGDTLGRILRSAGVDPAAAHAAAAALGTVFDPRRLQVGQRVVAAFSGDGAFRELEIVPDKVRRIVVRRGEDGAFAASEARKTLERRLALARGEIRSSLYGTLAAARVPARIIADVIHAYSWSVDFQREIRPADGVELAWEKLLDESGATARHGAVVYARLTLSGAPKTLYGFRTKSGWDYFDADGRSARRALMRTPIDGARLSSGFGPRRHPILGYTKKHLGADFAAPTGTPVYAAGDGVVVRRGRNGAYGNYVRIRHNSRYATAYAHLSRFGPGIGEGSRVRQRQVIGYVGSTGRSTGPHLHYEILVNGRRIDPLKMRMPPGRGLSGAALARFAEERGRIDRAVAALRTGAGAAR